MKVIRKIIKIDDERCNGCGQCILACAEGTLELIGGKAKVISDNLCDGLGACIGECPTGALTIEQREAEEFDEVAVEKRLAEIEGKRAETKSDTMPRGCPSTQIMDFGAGKNDPPPVDMDIGPLSESELTHWPVKIRLVPSNAPFLKNADVLVLADCVPAAYPDLHKHLIKGRAVMMGCPKFDDAQQYIDKMEKICRHGGIKRLTSVIMDVPCCSGMHRIVREGREASGMDIPLQEIVIDRRGKIIEKRVVS
jgi:NAD-dependent dihydropyrimidine dehydrogenase PreA subunit